MSNSLLQYYDADAIVTASIKMREIISKYQQKVYGITILMQVDRAEGLLIMDGKVECALLNGTQRKVKNFQSDKDYFGR